MPKLSVHIVTWNSLAFLENALGSLDAQTWQDFSVLIVDNNSQDGTREWLREHYPQIKLVKNNSNLGFARAHNQAISFTKSQYVLVMNPDIILTDIYLEKLVSFMDAQPKVGSVTGKIYQLQADPGKLTERSFTKNIDSLGLRAYKSRRFVDLGAGEIDRGQFDASLEVFGVSGSLAFYRREALEDIAINISEQDQDTPRPTLGQGGKREYFDEDFHAYREDVDLAWRLRLRGWQAWVFPAVKAYHRRTAAIKDKLWDKGLALSVMSNRDKKPTYVHVPAYRNHLCMLVKNEQNFIKDFPFILWYELRKLVYLCLFEQKTLKGLGQFIKLLPKMLAKRKIIQSYVLVGRQQMRPWFE